MVSAGVVNSFIDREVEAWVLWNLPCLGMGIVECA